ncbi:MAG: hypothetical protein KBT21_03680 [Treponema sp.]|nr:hypothetical protein [Candidatus Treponema merdequi]
MSARKLMLDLPLKLILTEAGASNFISHRKNLKRIKLADNVEEYGVSLNKFSPQSIQNMLLLEYVSKIEISMSEFVSKRQEVMDLSKLIVYSVLYKQFDREIFQAFIASDCVRRHNRQNPAQLIDEKTNIGEMKLRQMLSTKNGLIEQTRKAILAPIWKGIMSNKDYSPEEKNVYLLTSEKFMNRLGLLNWYIITKFSKDENFSEMLSSIRSLLTRYMDKSKVAEYISVMVMELALNNENSNIKKEAQQMYQDRDDINTLVLDPDVRRKIVRELESKHEQVFLSWKLGGGSSSIGKQGRLHITLYNKDDEFQEVKTNFESKAQADTNKRSLVDFYRELPEGEEGTDLGMYYLSYLDDACKKVNVKFESLVNQYSTSGLTVINLIFNF